MDWFYKLNVALLIAIGVIVLSMIVQHEMNQSRTVAAQEDSSAALKRKYEQQMAKNAWLYKKVLVLEKKGKLNEAMEELHKILAEHPSDAYGFVLEARLLYRQGHLADAIHFYRKAIEMDPDYVDRKTPLYIGDEIMKVISNSRAKLHRERKLKPGDPKIKAAIDDIYYLQRRIAGGCE
ncbi:MAG: tetratricopeptide repeat protein [Thermodesulfobacteria bacterium]|nr:tetratricopeptide repeat protein [Thermodesulfobacteriota bacterium]